MKGGSGLYINANDKDAFLNFMSNSTPKLLTSGLTGMAYKCTLNPGINSDYLSLDASNYGTPVRKLLVKVSFILPIETIMTFMHKGEQRNIKTIAIDDFNEEINIQTDVYLKTMQYLQPLCPAIVYADIVEINSPLINKLKTAFPSEIKNQLTQYPGIKIGLIGMELMEPSENMFYLLQDPNYYISYLSKMLYALIELVIKTGYNHGDFHAGNFLFETHIDNYFKGKIGRVVVIDFGFTEKLSKNKYEQIKTLFKSKRYSDILNLLCDIPRKDGYDMTTWPSYMTTCLRGKPTFPNTNIKFILDKNQINQKIDELYRSRELAIDDLVSSFKPKHLPLSNADKKNMYTGYIIDKPLVSLSFASIQNNSSNKMHFDELINKIVDILSVQNISEDDKMKYTIKACYNFLYLLNIGFGLEELTMYVALFYTGVFTTDWFSTDAIISSNGISPSNPQFSVFGTPSPPNSSDESILTTINKMLGGFLTEQIIYKSIVIDAQNLQKIRFNTILDYLPNEALIKNKALILEGMKTSMPYEEPNIFSQQFLETRINQLDSTSNNFEQLPFYETTGGKTRRRNIKKSKLKKSKTMAKRSKLYSRNKK